MYPSNISAKRAHVRIWFHSWLLVTTTFLADSCSGWKINIKFIVLDYNTNFPIIKDDLSDFCLEALQSTISVGFGEWRNEWCIIIDLQFNLISESRRIRRRFQGYDMNIDITCSFADEVMMFVLLEASVSSSFQFSLVNHGC